MRNRCENRSERETFHEFSYSAQFPSEDVIDVFYEHIQTLQPRIEKELLPNKPMLLKEEEEAAFINSTTCYICKTYIGSGYEKYKARDHDHR